MLLKTNDTRVVRTQDETSIIINIASNRIAKMLVFDYIAENWNHFFERYGSVSFTLNRLVEKILENFNTVHELNLVKDFVSQHKSHLGLAEGAFKEAIEKIQINIRWMNTNFATLSDWLADKK